MISNPVTQNLPYLPLGPPARRKRGSQPLWLWWVKLPAPLAGQIIRANTIIIYDVCCYFTDLVGRLGQRSGHSLSLPEVGGRWGRSALRAVIERCRMPILSELRLSLSTSAATSRKYDPGFSCRSWLSACLPCRRQMENKSAFKASRRQSRGGRPGPPAWPLTKRPCTSRKMIGRSDGVAAVLSLCVAARSDETCR